MTLPDIYNAIKRNQEIQRTILLIGLLAFGLLLVYGFYRIEYSEEAGQYLNMSSENPSGFRFIVFLGIVKYGILLVGAVLSIMSVIELIKKKTKRHTTMHKPNAVFHPHQQRKTSNFRK